MAITFVNAGAVAGSSNAITPALPASIASGDILLLFIETANQAVSIATPNGGTWTQVPASPQGLGTAGSTGATRLTAFWSRYNGTQTAPVTNDSGDHQLGRILAFRGCQSSGDPIAVSCGGTEATSDTSISIPGVTTPVDGCMIVVACAGDLPDSTAANSEFASWANANLASVTEATDDANNSGNGGSLGTAFGIKATAGATGATTATKTNSAVKGLLSLALLPDGVVAAAPTLVSYTEVAYTGTGTSRNSASVSWLAGDVISVIAGAEGASTFGAPSNAGLSFSVQKQNNPGTSDCSSGVWAAVAQSDGSGVINMTENTGINHWGFSVWVHRNTDGIGNSAEQHTSTKTVSLTPSEAHGSVVWGVFDFAAAATQAITPTPTNTDEASVDTGRYTVYVADLADQTSAGATSYGISGTGTGPFSIVALEIKRGWSLPAGGSIAGKTVAGAFGTASLSGSGALAGKTVAGAFDISALAGAGALSGKTVAGAFGLWDTSVVIVPIAGRGLAGSFASGALTGKGSMAGKTVAGAFDTSSIFGIGSIAGRTAAGAFERSLLTGIGSIAGRSVAGAWNSSVLTGKGSIAGKTVAGAWAFVDTSVAHIFCHAVGFSGATARLVGTGFILPVTFGHAVDQAVLSGKGIVYGVSSAGSAAIGRLLGKGALAGCTVAGGFGSIGLPALPSPVLISLLSACFGSITLQAISAANETVTARSQVNVSDSAASNKITISAATAGSITLSSIS